MKSKETIVPKINAILFDLGGVLVELGDSPFPREWIGKNETFGSAEWFSSPQATDFECGRISVSEFLRAIKFQLGLSASEAEIRRSFTAWPIGLYSGTEALLRCLATNYKLAILSNTNPLHEPILLNDFGLRDMVDRIYFSHQLGLAKPAPEVYLHVLENLALEPHQVLFLDDNLINVKSAAELGIHAHQVYGLADVKRVIKEFGIIVP